MKKFLKKKAERRLREFNETAAVLGLTDLIERADLTLLDVGASKSLQLLYDDELTRAYHYICGELRRTGAMKSAKVE